MSESRALAFARRHGATIAMLLVMAWLADRGVSALWHGKDDRGPTARLILDAWYYHAQLASLLTDGDLDFTDEYRITGNWQRLGQTALGRPANHFPIGAPLLSAPFYVLGGAVAPDDTGFGETRVKYTLLASPLFTVFALWFAYRVIRRRLGHAPPAILAPALLAIAGPSLFYATRVPGYPHPAAMFVTAWLIDVWDASYDRPRGAGRWIAMGALLGVAALVRPQLLLWGVLLVAAAVDDLRHRPLRATAWRWALGALATAVVFAPQLLAWRAIYGSAFMVPQGAGFMVWTAPKWSEVLFAARNGLFAWTPLYAIAFVGLVWLLRARRRLAALLLLGVALQVWVNGAAWDWWGGPGFGQRRMDSCFLPFALGLGALLDLAWSRRRWLGAAVAGAALVAGVLCADANRKLVAQLGIWDVMRTGGAPVRHKLVKKVPQRWLARSVGHLSYAVTFPARAWFAVAHGAPLGTYDRVVGEHFLTEVYPGTGGPSRPVEEVALRGVEPYLIGFEATAEGARMREERATILVPLNKRHGPVFVELTATNPVRLEWNGAPVTGGALDPVDRATHELGVIAPAGTVLSRMRLEIKPGTPP